MLNELANPEFAAEKRPSPKSSPAASDAERWLLDGLLLICLLAIVAAKSIIPKLAVDEDLWWHLRTGDWIVSHRAVPTLDVFSTYTDGQSWIAYTWLFDVLSSSIYNNAGLHGILTLTVLLTLAFVVAVVVLFSQRGKMLRAIALAGLVFASSSTMVTPRPWLFTCLFFVVEFCLLVKARDTGAAIWLFPLAPLFMLWTNLHIQFVYGLGILALFALERPLALLLKSPCGSTRLRTGWLWSALVASILATLINPYGWRLYLVVLQYVTQAAPLSLVTEMLAMQFRSVTDWAALFLACSALLALSASGQKCALKLSLMTVALYLGFHTGRDVWFLAVIAAYIVADSAGPPEPGLAKVRSIQWAFALPVALALALSVLRSPAVAPLSLQQAAARRFPEAAAEFIQKNKMPGPLYNSYGWGGYLIWRLRDMPVSIDGRANLHGDLRLARAVNTWMGSPDWDTDPELMKAGTILLEHSSALASILRADSRFRVAYEDEIASVFQPALVTSAAERKTR